MDDNFKSCGGRQQGGDDVSEDAIGKDVKLSASDNLM
jgi:hypothetical protein